MNASVQPIPLLQLAMALIPALAVIAILYRWQLGGGNALYAVGRMLAQLTLVGFVLTFIFETSYYQLVTGVLVIMLIMSAWISIRTVKGERSRTYARALTAIFFGGTSTLILITQGVLNVEPWFAPRYVIPLAGMIFANAMNSVSLAAERFDSEIALSRDLETARRSAMRVSLIPTVNSLFAVGIVALPGMMTGQILSGISPLVAVRYQIMVMCMLFGASGLAAALYLVLTTRGHRLSAGVSKSGTI